MPEPAATDRGASDRGATDYGAQLIRAARTMDRLRSPGGCPWDAEQTHASLAPYLLEEAYEALDAIQSGEALALREELGDLLLQVLFHARLAEEAVGADRFDIDDVAADLVAKLIRRHPHVFADVSVTGADEVNANWDEIKRAEKQRTSALDGVPLNQPALALAIKLLSRARKAGLATPAPVGDGFGERLFALAAEAAAAGIDPELALRATALRFADQVRRDETRAGEHRG